MKEPAPTPSSESAPIILAKLLSVVLCLAVLGFLQIRRPAPPRSSPVAPTPLPPPRIPEIAAAPVPAPEPPPPPPAPTLDREAVAQAEAKLEAAHQERLRAEARTKEAAEALATARVLADHEAAMTEGVAEQVRDPEARLARATAGIARIAAERDALKAEIATLQRAPRPHPRDLIDRTPVARPTQGDEFHFEVRRNRVSFVDLEHLLELVKVDARIRLRMPDSHRPIVSTVGPVGPFALTYEMGRSIESIEDLLDPRSQTYSLKRWEITSEFESRGEPFDQAMQPISAFARAVHRLDPNRASVTLWVYPDSFGLYRRLRDVLHARGFVVAARPMPEGMTIRGSPMGSLSAGQ